MNRRETRSSSYADRVVPALLVIGVGVFFLLRNFGFHVPFLAFPNWWAWFILIAAISPLSHALQHYRRAGRVDGDVLHSLLSVAAIVMVALIFILELSWTRWWPIFVIYGGLCILVRESKSKPSGGGLPDREKAAQERPFSS